MFYRIAMIGAQHITLDDYLKAVSYGVPCIHKNNTMLSYSSHVKSKDKLQQYAYMNLLIQQIFAAHQ